MESSSQLTRAQRATLDFDIATPVHLNAQATLRSGDSNIALGDAFRNPLPVPLELHELKWALAVAPEAGSNTSAHGLMVECSISYSTFQITRAPVPLHVLSPLVNARNENNAFNGIANATFIQDTYGAVFGRMKFDEPIYLLPGEQINIALNHKAVVPWAITANVGVSGRGVRSIPRVRRLPYITSWVPPFLDIGTAYATAPARVDSTEADLVNASGVSVALRRLIGRVVLSTSATSGTSSITVLGDSPDARDLVLMQMRSSHSDAIVKDSIPIGVVFAPPSFAIEAPMIMEPNAYLLATLTTQGFASVTASYKANCALAAIGYREIE